MYDRKRKLIVLYTGKHCYACKSFRLLVEKLAKEFRVPLEVIDLGVEKDPYDAYIRSLPGLAVLLDRKVWDVIIGARSEKTTRQWLKKFL